MEEPSEEFIEMIVTLAKVDQMKQQKNRDIDIDTNNNNNNSSRLKSASKQQYKEYVLDQPDKVVSWLLYLIVNGTYPTIKDKSIQLLDRLFEKEEEEEEDYGFIDELSKPILDAVEFETEELLNNFSTLPSITDTFKCHLISIIESIANYRMRQPLDQDEETYATAHDNLLLILKKSNGSVSGARIEYALQQLMYLYLGHIWIEDQTLQNNDTLIDVLDRHSLGDSEKGFAYKSTKRLIYDFILVMAETEPHGFTDSHLERIVTHLYDWLIDVKDVSLEEWTHCNDKIDIDTNFFNFPNNGGQNDHVIQDDEQEEEEEENAGDLKNDDSEVTNTPKYSIFGKFAKVFGQRIEGYIFNQFSILSTSKQWKDRYAAMISLSQSCKHIPHRIVQQFQFILKLVLKCTDDENMRVRWASFQSLIRLSFDFNDMIIESSGEIFKVIGKSIHDPNQRIQSCCCVLIHTMMELLKNDDNIVDNNVLDALLSSIEILLQSSKIYVVENALISLMSVIQNIVKGFIPYYKRFIPILLSLLEKHNGTRESKLLRIRTIKTFIMCFVVVDLKTFSKDYHKFMAFVKKNHKSFDLIVYVFEAFDVLMKIYGKTFKIYLPMIVKLVITTFETPLPNQLDDITPSVSQEITKLMSTLNILSNRVSLSKDGSVYQPLTQFVHRLVGPLCKLTINPLFPKLRIQSLACLPLCIELFKLRYGDRSEKTLEAFGKIYEMVLCHQETDLRVAVIRMTMSTYLINAMGKDAMTFDQVQSTLDAFNRMEKWTEDIEIAEDDDDRDQQELIETSGYALVAIYGMISVMIEYNGAISAPLITSNFLTKICNKLRNDQEADVIKVVLLNFLAHFCQYGGDSAINAFPQIIPTIIDCLQLTGITTIRNASIALGAAAQISKDRFSPWVIDTLDGFDNIIYAPDMYPGNKDSMQHIIASMGKIIRYVPYTSANNLVTFIPEWLNHPIISKIEDQSAIVIVIDTLCTIIPLYPKDCLGEQYQQVVRIHQIIQHYLKISQQPEEIQRLEQTWLFIKDTFDENWNSIPEVTRDRISKLELETLSNLN
ncbi:hypothetical protein DFA_00472 [Cavenderia fasciculata]|uniref:Uncharacterized protein n=1 Tax=Cavenderia fasciculata TaxID=261658 RepID=F4PS13_CACFS|nr:uncharacterized protein DFA_00472 [Cavenderia fasciculata]EGG20611.1 hypothetical protein DFA_00472 [Cavenderia fasciculata]|eukprot:XP_004358461.1 hypothetical protein DFA_00472 [Cavenderia fasciculata]